MRRWLEANPDDEFAKSAWSSRGGGAVAQAAHLAVGRGFVWLPVCNPLHNRSLSPAVNRKPSISTGYQRSGGSRRTGSGVDPDFIPLPDFSTSLLLTF